MYSPLTKEQFEKVKSSGFSTDQIIAFEQKRKSEDPVEIFKSREQAISENLNPVQNFGVGLVKSGLGTIKGLGELGTKIGEGVGLPKLSSSGFYRGTTDAGAKADAFLEGSGAGQKTGKIVGDVAQFIAPSTGIAKIEKPLGLIGRVGVEAATTAGITAAQTGGDVEAMKINAGIAGAIPVAGALLKGAAPVFKTGKEAVERAATPVALRTPKIIGDKKVWQSVTDDFYKAIRPSIKPTISKATGYNEKATKAIETIVRNKGNLQLLDEAGQPISRLPESIDDLGNAIQQTKQSLYKQYSELSSGASGMREVVEDVSINTRPTKIGVAHGALDLRKTPPLFQKVTKQKPVAPISTKSIANELDIIANSDALKTLSPADAAYASDLAQKLRGMDEITPAKAQEFVEHLNAQLQAFEKNPNYNDASKAAINAMVRNSLNKQADEAIELALDKSGYLDLKSQYGALKEIERDVVRRLMVEARKNNKGLIDFTDIFSGGQVVSGLLSMNPAQVAQGLTQKTIAGHFKKLNDPNRLVKKMFERADTIINPQTVKGSTNPIVQRVFGQK